VAVDYRALADFRYAIRKFLAFSETAAAEAGLSSQQHQALLTIKGIAESGGLSIGALAGRLFVRHHTAVELIDRLERIGLVYRAPDPKDGRRVLVALTEEGEMRLRQLASVHLDELSSVGPQLIDILASLLDAQPKQDSRSG